MTRSLSVLAAVSLLAANCPAAADILTFIATGPVAPGLSPVNENPPHPESSGSGTAMVTWDTLTNIMMVNVVFSGLTTPNTAAHIHCCVSPPGNTGVATTVPTFTGFPTGQTSGSYSHTFDMLTPGSFNPAFVTANGGTAASAAAALLAVPVDISIKPGASPPVRINPQSHGTIPVAILSTPTLDAVTNVDTSSVTFGRTGDEQSLAFCNSGGEDINGDGLPDLMCHFETQLADFQSGDVLGILKGKTVQGSPIIGQEAMALVP